jgi:Ca2+-binding RTX toxin-like protein
MLRLTRHRPRRARIVTAALSAALVGALGLAPAASAQIAPPYTLTVGAGKVAVNPALGGSTVAISVVGGGGSVTFTPAATTIAGTDPGACTSGPFSTTCTAASMSTELRVEEILQVDIRGVATAKMALVGDADSDAIVVEGPAAPAQVTLLDVFTGAGADALTVSGNVLQVQDDSGPADVSADRYVIDSPAITGTLLPAGGNDYVEIRAGLLNANGGEGVDTLIGPNSLNGGDGDDQLKPTAVGAQVDGGAGVDRVSYERLVGDHVLVQNGSDVSIDGQPNVKDVEQVEAGPGNDTVTGDGAANVLFGGAGNDIIAGGGGADKIDGDAGDDTVNYDDAGGVTVNLFTRTGGPAGAVDDLTSIEAVSTGPGPDTVTGTDAPERFALGAGDDVLDAGFGNDIADGGDGDDLLRGGRGTDQLTGGPGTDTVTYDERTSGEPVTVKLGAPGNGGTGAENDVLAGIENAIGTAGPDILTGDAFANRLTGGAGTDTIDGGAGNDTLLGSGDRDIIDGGPGNDALFGESGDDTLKAFDTVQDTVDCGESPDDDAQLDPIDIVAGCEFSRRGDIPIPTDADGDGIAPPFDCDDTKAAINPGATDVPADKIDQNCDGFDEALPFVPIRFALAWRSTSKGRRVGSLVATRLLPGHEIRMTCTPPKGRKTACPFKRTVRKPKGSSQRLVLTSVFRRRALPKGTVVELRVTGPGHVGKVFTFRILSATAQREVRRCLTKGNNAKPAVCPAEEA